MNLVKCSAVDTSGTVMHHTAQTQQKHKTNNCARKPKNAKIGNTT